MSSCKAIMGYIAIELDEESEKTFRDKVVKQLGMKKGNIKTAIEQAMKMRIEKDITRSEIQDNT